METFPAELVEQPVQNRTGRNSPVPKGRRGAGRADGRKICILRYLMTSIDINKPVTSLTSRASRPSARDSTQLFFAQSRRTSEGGSAERLSCPLVTELQTCWMNRVEDSLWG